jgi:N-ethylmaleimide reductase
MSSNLFEPFQLGVLTLANRMVMAPMTRNRANEQDVVQPITATYYQQRASTGLIITEGSPVSPEAVGYPGTPGIYTDAQVAGWRHVIDTVHAQNGHIFVQLWHCGRISHPTMQPNGNMPVAPSALRPSGQVFTYTGPQDYVTPRELETREIPNVVEQFKCAAEMAKRAGFDGVELHAANGYLIDQFLRDGTNHRSDAYGGSVENRMRLLNEILDAVCTVLRTGQVGVRLSPENSFNSMSDSDPETHFGYFLEQLNSRDLAYLHVLEGDMMTKTSALDYRVLRSKSSGPYIANNGYDRTRAEAALQDGADLVSFGIPFLANPDLVRRYQENLPLNEADPSTFYGGSEVGYTDYPFYGA